ncbi:MAG: hypothetical protein LLF94_02715 [Chlamydiales bacterium]|nr:hypothetical protein [Chlamydiales bacterium]
MNTFVYRWPFIFWCCVLLGLVAVLAIRSNVASTSEADTLQSLIESSPNKIRKERKKEMRELTQQVRHGVTKQIYLAEGPLRRLMDLSAARSNIRVVSKRPHMRVVETFYEVTGIVQHELYYVTQDGQEVVYDDLGQLALRNKKPLLTPIDDSTLIPKQHFRYFEATEAVYDFHTNQLLAYGVKFWTYTADGHEKIIDRLKLVPEAVGEASRMTFYVSGPKNKNQFSAEFLKVQFTPEGGI